jgi:hypothetical protein
MPAKRGQGTGQEVLRIRCPGQRNAARQPGLAFTFRACGDRDFERVLDWRERRAPIEANAHPVPR